MSKKDCSNYLDSILKSVRGMESLWNGGVE